MEQRSTKTEQAELLQSQNSAAKEPEFKKQSGKELVIRKEHKGLNYIGLINEPEQTWFGILGHHRITEEFKSEDELLEFLESEPFHVMLHIASVVVATHKEWAPKTKEASTKM